MSLARFPDLEGASVFVTGGGSGIGAALTEGFLRQGAQVTFAGRSDYAAFVEDMTAATGTTPTFVQGDVTDTATLQSAIADTAARQGGLDVLINNAADDMRYTAAEISPETWAEQTAVNLDAYFFGCQAAAAIMGETGGSIVNFSSITFQLGAAGMVPYMTSNAGIVGMTRALAREWGPQGIRVNAIAPGWVLTRKQLEKWADEESLAAFKEKQCLPRFLEPADMVGPALFLAAEASAAVTGQTLIADAGVVHG